MFENVRTWMKITFSLVCGDDKVAIAGFAHLEKVYGWRLVINGDDVGWLFTQSLSR